MQTESITELGTGEHTYRVVGGWAKPAEGKPLGEVVGLAVDKNDRVYAFNRSKTPMMVFDRDGNLVDSWGEGMFRRAHGISLGTDDSIYCTDDVNHTVTKCTLDGKVLMTLGTADKPSPFMSGEPFNRCTHTALSPQGDIYVTDGYGNARVHKFSSDGKWILSWGESGTGPGAFNVVHNLSCDAAGWVYVVDRENHRVQVFDGNGKYQTEWRNMHRPNGIWVGPGPDGLGYLVQGGPAQKVNMRYPNIGACVSIHTKKGELVARLGKPDMGAEPGQFMQPHGVAVDSHGDIYVGESSPHAWARTFPGVPVPHLEVLWKLVKTPQAKATG